MDGRLANFLPEIIDMRKDALARWDARQNSPVHVPRAEILTRDLSEQFFGFVFREIRAALSNNAGILGFEVAAIRPL